MAKKNINIKGDEGKNIAIQNLIIRPVQRGRADINKWRSAHRAAEAQHTSHRVELYDLYDEALIDTTLGSLIEKRIMAITNTKLRFVRDGEDVEEFKNLIKQKAFKKMLREMMLSKFWGISLLEFSFALDGKMQVFSVPRKHIRPKQKLITYEQSGQEGFAYNQGIFINTMMEIGDADDLGLLLKAIPFVLYKRGAMGDWAQFAEIFGMPIKVGRYDAYDTTTRLQLEQALDEAGSALSIVIPKEAMIELLESKNTADGSRVFESLKNACNDELAILILGQTETTRSSASSGYAQAKVHGQTEDDINQDDRDYIISILESDFNAILQANGFNVAGGEWLFEDPEENISLKDRVIIDTTLKNAGLPISDEYLYERYNIPKPDNYDELIAEKKATHAHPTPPTDPNQPEPPKPGEKKKEDPKAPKNLSQRFKCFFG